MVRLLILVARGNRGLRRGILTAGSWGREHWRYRAEQGGGARVIRMLRWHALRVIDGGGMDDRWRGRV